MLHRAGNVGHPPLLSIQLSFSKSRAFPLRLGPFAFGPAMIEEGGRLRRAYLIIQNIREQTEPQFLESS